MGRASRKKKERKIETPLQGENSAAKHETTGFLTSPVVAIILLSILAFLIYSNTFSVPFLFDDSFNIEDNPKIKSLRYFLDLSGTRYMGFLTFAINYAIGGLKVFGYHLVNLLIHIVNGFLVYSLVLLLFQAATRERSLPSGDSAGATSNACPPAVWRESRVTDHAHFIALTAALLFIAHPIQTQAVTYIVQRLASLVTVFYLLAVICYLKWRMSPEKTKRHHLWYVAALLSCVLAMKTKENSFTIPLMIVLVEIVFWGARPITRKRLGPLIPFLLTLLIVPLSRGDIIGEAKWFARDVTLISRSDYFFTQFRVIVTYLRLLVWPIDQCLDYDYTIYHALSDHPVFISFLFLSFLFGLAVYFLRRSSPFRILAFGIFWFFLTLSVESSFIPINDVIYEHRVYLPSVGFFLVIGLLAAWGLKRWQRMNVPIFLFVLIVIGGLSIATYQRNRIWQDPLTFWKDVAQKAPLKPRGHTSLGVFYNDMERLDEAFAEFQTALRLDPNDVMAHNNLGTVYKKRGLITEAIEEFQTALRLDPNNAVAHINMGALHKDQGQLAEAIEEYQTALRLQPHNAVAHINLGIVYKDQGRLTEAIEEYKTALRLRMDQAVAHTKLGLVYRDQGLITEAIEEYKTALRLKPDDVEAHHDLGVAYGKQGRPEEAMKEFQAALRLQPNLVETRYNLGQAYLAMGMFNEARGEFEEVLRINPGMSAARKVLDALSKQVNP